MRDSLGGVLPSSPETQSVVRGGGLGHPARARGVPAGEGRGGGQPGPGLAGGKPRGWTPADAVEPLAGEAGKEARVVQEPGAAVHRGECRPQVGFTVTPAIA